MKNKIRSQGTFKAIADQDAVYIEGYANYNAPDSVKERLDPASVNTKRFAKNPMLLFNHNMDYVVGKVISVEPRDEGVWAKAQLSLSDDPKISYVRDLVSEGILKTFSVRFADETWEDDPENPGVKLAKNWELQELSIVSIPMQADSTFSIAKGILDNVKNISEVRSRIMRQKGRAVAALLNKRLSELESSDGFNRDDFLRAFAVAAGVTEPELADIMAGKTTPVPNGVIQAAESQLNIERSELDAAQGADAEAAQKGEGEMPNLESETQPTEKDAVSDCIKEKIPLLIKEGKEQDQAVAMAMSMCNEEKGCNVAYTDDEMKQFLMYADACGKQSEPDTMEETEPKPEQKAEGVDLTSLTELVQKQSEMLSMVMDKMQTMADALSALLKDEQGEMETESSEDETDMQEKALAMEKEIDLLHHKLKGLVG